MGNRLGLALAGCAIVAGGVLIGLNERPHQTPAPTPSVSPQTACELAVMHRVPAPADFTWTDTSTGPAAGGGYHLAGTVQATGSASGRYSWTCDVELRNTSWYPWSVTVTPFASAAVLH